MATYYVDYTNGSDSDPGTEAEPWKTVNKAVTTATAGDTVIYEDDTYDLGTDQSTWNSGSAGSGYITHQARNTHLAIWEQTSYGGDYGINLVSVDYVKFVGIRMQQQTKTYKNRLVNVELCSFIEFNQVEITNCASHGMVILGSAGGSCDNITIDDCDIHPEDSGSVNPGKDAIHIRSQNCSDIVIKNSRIYHSQHDGIGNSTGNVANCDVHIHDNTIYEIDSHGVSLNQTVATIEDNIIRGAGTWPLDDNDSNGVRLLDDVDATVRFNQIYECSGRALWVSVTSGTVSFHHNTCYGNNYKPGLDDQGHIQFRDDGTPTASITFKNNIIYKTVADRRCLKSDIDEAYISEMDYNLWYDDSESDTYMRRNGTTYASITDYLASFESNSVEGDPLFNDASSDDFTLQASSPAIDAGDDLGYAYIGSAPDMGYWEYGTSIVTAAMTSYLADAEGALAIMGYAVLKESATATAAMASYLEGAIAGTIIISGAHLVVDGAHAIVE